MIKKYVGLNWTSQSRMRIVANIVRRLPYCLLCCCVATLSEQSYAKGHKEVPSEMAVCFSQSAQAFDVPKSLLMAVGRTESNFDPEAISHALAIGIMQIQWPQTARHLGVESLDKLFDPCVSIDLGAKYLRELHNRYGSWEYVLAAYNYGPGRISLQKPMPEGAAKYVGKVLAHKRMYQDDSPATPERHVIVEVTGLGEAEAIITWLQVKVDALRFDIQSLDQHRHIVVAFVPEGASPNDARRQIRKLAQR